MKRRATFGKIQRERDKQEKAALKREKRATRGDDVEDDDDVAEPADDQGAVLSALAKLHEAFDNGDVNSEDFEEQRAALTARLRVD